MNKHVALPQKLAVSYDPDIVKIKTERNSLGVLKTILVILLIAIQFGIFIWSSLYLLSLFQVLTLFSIFMTIFTAIHVLSTNKNSQSKPVWILFLIVCFSFGWIIYFISSENVFWRKHKKPYEQILTKTKKHL